MGRASAVKAFLERDSSRGPIPAGEFMAFWKACTDSEKVAFSTFAASELGVTLKEA